MKAPFAIANETYSITMSKDINAGNVMARLVFYGNPGYAALPQAAYVFNVAFEISFHLSFRVTFG